ncbi:nectin-4-like [Micropterus salmoides]|uniref:nectin-4-like n=1 Tax=Micropterus salmoides TaxID=27706 RepID=UPI0018EC427E|nr:nectin-4-like [Micropterus salmoides]
MAVLTSTPALALFTCSWIFALCQEQLETLKPGEDATLQCRGYRGAVITVIEWSRSDLEPDDGYVFYFRDGRLYENYQHSLFRGRVELRDPEMKDGDSSVILKNVSINDTGTYECRIGEENTRRRKRDAGKPDPSSIIRLTVTEPGHTAGNIWEGGDKEGNVALKIGPPVGVLLLNGVFLVSFNL